jgi:hypothetical protein
MSGILATAALALTAPVAERRPPHEGGRKAIKQMRRLRAQARSLRAGVMYANGQGVPQDYAQAIILVRVARSPGLQLEPIRHRRKGTGSRARSIGIMATRPDHATTELHR